MVGTFRVVLKQDEGYDVHDVREFDVTLGSKFAIGRASKNTSKGYLLPAKHNVYIDSPVISREHAILTANASSGTPKVYITDTKSMHGTFVNGTPLVPNTPKQLSNGDKLQFGINVNRNESYYLAYKYSFNAELTNSELFSRGFTVPEAESEEEDISTQSTRGSQLDPLFIEDSDAESESWEPKDNGDVTMAQLDEEAGQHEAAIGDESDEDEEETSLASIADSDIESDAVSTGSAHSHGSDSPLFHGAQYIEDVEKITATEQVEARPADQGQLTATLSAPTHPTPAEQASAAMPFYGEFGYSNVPDMPFSPNPVSQNVESTPFDMTFAPPLPPRPSQKLQRMWDEVLQEDYQEKWLAEGSHDAPVFPSANFSAHAPLYRDTPFRASQQIELPHISSFSPELVSTFKPAADRIQTPPPTLTADVVSSTPPPPTRRTGVSITEIVDEQPPTPTSVNSRKRSADDAFNEDAEHNDENMAAAGALRAESTPATANTALTSEEGISHSVEQAAPLSHRPIAQPRSVLRKALRAASLMLPATAFGAAVSIAALAALPESFFTVA